MIRFLTAGESHGQSLTGIVEGLPAGVHLTEPDIDLHLSRRWLGHGRGGRAKIENDKVTILSGVRFSKTIGGPIALSITNAAHHRDKAGWERVMAKDGDGSAVEKIVLPRPGHADLAGLQKYQFDDIRPVIERSSARETAMRVACCSVPRAMLAQLGINIASHVIRIGEIGYSDDDRLPDTISYKDLRELNVRADTSDVRMLDDRVSAECIAHIDDCKASGDSLGGIYEVVVSGVPVGLGSYVHWDRRLDGLLAQAILSIQAQKAVEIGHGVLGARTAGSAFHDEIVGTGQHDSRSSNNAGGVEGGMSNGMPIIVRGYMKPIPTLIKPLQTINIRSGESMATRYERSDVTSVPAASVVAEAMVSFVIANAILEKFGGDTLQEIVDRVTESRNRSVLKSSASSE